MRARIVGGALAWAASLAPLVVVNLIAYVGLFTPDVAAVIGAVALLAGVALGAVVAGLSGGRALDPNANTGGGRPATPRQQAPPLRGKPAGWGDTLEPRLGARGALATGGIAATLYALTMGGLIQLANTLNILPNIVTQHPIRITAAILCVAAIFAGLAMLVGWWVARGATADDLEAEPAPAGARMRGAMSAPLGDQMGAAAAMRGRVAPTRPLSPSPPARGAAPATRPLSSAEIGGPAQHGARADSGGQGGYGAYARLSQAASRPRLPSDPRYGAPADQPRNSRDARDAYPPRDARDEYRREDDSYRDDDQYHDDRQYDQRHKYDDRDRYDDDDGDRRYPDSSRERADRRSRRGGQRDFEADDYDGYADGADAWRRGDDRRRDIRAGGRRLARGHDRYEE